MSLLMKKLQENVVGIFGAGHLGSLVANVLLSNKITNIVYIDDTPAKQNTLTNGLLTVSKNEFHNLSKNKGLVIISIYKPGFDFLQAKKFFSENFNLEAISFIEIFHALADEAFNFLFIEHPKKFFSKLESYKKIEKLLSDDLSRQVLKGHIRLRQQSDFSQIIYTAKDDVNFLKKALNDDVIYVDCGAFDGDSIINFFKIHGNNFFHIHAIEPDLYNVAKLKDNINQLLPSEKYSIHHAALYKSKSKIKFKSNGNLSSCIDENGEILVDTVIMSDFATDKQLYFKLDVEGEELSSIVSSENFIKHYKPILGISVYHRPDDLLNIINFLNSLSLNYQFYLRCHGKGGEDLMLYCLV